MDIGNIKQEDCKWSVVENYNATADSHHCYYPKTCLTPYVHEKYEGVGALCNRKRMISEDGCTSISIDKVEESTTEHGKCKTCEKIFNQLT